MAQSTQRAVIAEALAEIKLIDTHEHIVAEDVRLETELDFTSLLPDYLSSDLVSAGTRHRNLPPALAAYACRHVGARWIGLGWASASRRGRPRGHVAGAADGSYREDR